MEFFPVLVCIVAMILWATLWRRLASDPPIVWTRRRVVSLSVAILGVVAVPFLVGIGLWLR